MPSSKYPRKIVFFLYFIFLQRKEIQGNKETSPSIPITAIFHSSSQSRWEEKLGHFSSSMIGAVFRVDNVWLTNHILIVSRWVKPLRLPKALNGEVEPYGFFHVSALRENHYALGRASALFKQKRNQTKCDIRKCQHIFKRQLLVLVIQEVKWREE